MKVPIFDGHNDSILEIFFEKRNFLKKNKNGHIDFPKAKEGDFRAGLFAICPPAENIKERASRFGLIEHQNGWEIKYPKSLSYSFAKKFTDHLLEFAFGLEKIKLIKNTLDLKECFQKDQLDSLGMILHFEGAEAIDAKLENLDYYYQKGLRSLGITWSRENIFGYGVPFKFPSSSDIGSGLTSLGKDLVRKCNELGIIVDLAHINQKGFWEVTKISKKPLVVSHGNVFDICPVSRNFTLDQIKAIAKSNGIIGINFSIKFLRPDGIEILDTPLELIIDHIDYIINKVGCDFVGFGSDFDGTTIPSKLKSVADMPLIIEALEKRGYSFYDIEKIAYKNWLRVIEETWK